MKNEAEKDYLELWGVKLKTSYFWLIVIGCFIGWYLFTVFWGFKEIGRFGEKRDYTTKYWVYLQPENAQSKNYRVKADIERAIPDYFLRRVYWPNGGYSNFDDCLLDKEEYQANDSVYCKPEGEDTGYNIKIYLTDKVKQ